MLRIFSANENYLYFFRQAKKFICSLILLLVFSLAGCNPAATPPAGTALMPASVTFTPQPSALPSSTAQPEPERTPTHSPTSPPTATQLLPTKMPAPAPTLTPMPEIEIALPAGSLLYTAPGKDSPWMVEYRQAVTLTLVGRNADGGWLALAVSPLDTGWLETSLVTLSADTTILPVLEIEALATLAPTAKARLTLTAWEAPRLRRQGGEDRFVPTLQILIENAAPGLAINYEVRDEEDKIIQFGSVNADAQGTAWIYEDSYRFKKGIHLVRIKTKDGEMLEIQVMIASGT